jgi:hypothetical protein
MKLPSGSGRNCCRCGHLCSTAKTDGRESEVDQVATFYHDNRVEMEKDYRMAFGNPVFDDAAGGSSVAYDKDWAEAVEM